MCYYESFFSLAQGIQNVNNTNLRCTYVCTIITPQIALELLTIRPHNRKDINANFLLITFVLLVLSLDYELDLTKLT